MFDNATIHKSKKSKNEIQNLQTNVITICPHTPEMNPCEFFFRALKMKIKVYLDQLKPLNEQLIRNCADSITMQSYSYFICKTQEEATRYLIKSTH